MIEVKTKEFEDEKYRRLSIESKCINSMHEKLSNAMAAKYEIDLQFAATKGFVCGLNLMEKLLYWMGFYAEDGERMSDEVIQKAYRRRLIAILIMDL